MGDPASEPTVRDGDVLAGRYRLVRLLGEGGMGAVWEARQVTTDKIVALKLLKRREASDVARFLREARLAAALSHRNIVQVFDYWEVEGGGPVFLVMELFEGRTLAERMEGAGPMALDEVLAIARPVAAALRYAHAQGVVHRDLKPENVFLARMPEGAGATEVKVVDFGLARPTVPDTAATAITQTGAVMGTPYYMAPEQVYGDKDVDGRADVWALGAVVWECLAGHKPFDGENFGQIFKRISQADVRPLAEVAPGAPAWLASLVGRMLAHAREDRPTMAEVQDALTHEGAPAKDTSAPPPARTQATVRWPGPEPVAPALPVATRLTATTSMRPSVPPAKKSTWWIVGVAIAALAVGATMLVATGRGASTKTALPSAASAAIAPATSAIVPAPSAAPPASVEAPAPEDSAPLPEPTAAPSPVPRRPRPVHSAPSPSKDPLGRGRF